MPVTPEEARKFNSNPIEAALANRGITAELLAEKLQQELNALTMNLKKLKGVVNVDDLPDGTRSVGWSESNTLLAVDMIDWRTRQAARQDAHKLLNHYPAKELSFGIKGVEEIIKAIEDSDEI